jgi:hypothetical protein
MAPPTLFAVVFDRTRPLALRTFHVIVSRPLYIDLDKLLLDLQFHVGDEPWWNKAQ